jgi:Amt family ammonium transporter
MKLPMFNPMRAAFAFLAVALISLPVLADEAAPTIDQRVAALEAYVNNSDPGKSLTGVPGPGHNAWMMTSSALVLFMTLPGLALFYGGLVRRKNVLSVLAQCLGIAGLVTIIWWAFGYSFVFGKSFSTAQGRDLRAQHRLRLLGFA